MRSWASAACAAGLVLAGPTATRAASPHVGAKRLLTVATGGGRPMPVRVAIVPEDVDPDNDHAVRSLGARGPFLLVADSYASRAQSLSRCQAGHETWVRLIDTRARAERWSHRVESCLHDIQPGDPVATWAATGQAFTVNMLSEPSIHVAITPAGRVVAR